MDKKVLKIYHSCNPHSGYSRWVKNAVNVSNLEEADVLWIDGGGDFCSELYGQKSHKHNWNTGYSKRDTQELEDIDKAVKSGKFILGTCRGLQALHIYSKYPLIQDISHSGSHKIKTFDGKELVTSSLHHQMIDPTNIAPDKCKIIAWAEGLSPYHKNGDDEEVNIELEPEIAYYPQINGLGWQGHPEMQSPNSDMVKYCQELIDKLIEHKL